MRRYWWPGYGTQLLEELQRQQNTTQFCDTLLQTEGISVPAHSCILAALSPYLSRKLSASPPPAPGQKRLLQLQSVKAQTLLKLVGLLYSGELEVKETEEQNDVLAAAHIFGVKDLVEGDKNGMMRLFGSFSENSSPGSERKESRKRQDARVQAEMAGWRDVDSPAENSNHMMTGTQTGEKTFGDCFTSDCAPSAAQNVEVSSLPRPQSITIDEHFCFSSCPVIPSLTSRALNDAMAASGRPTTSASSSNTMAFPHSLDGDANSTEDQTHQHSKEYWKSLQEKAKKTGPDGKTIGQTLDKRENTEEPHQAKNKEKRNPRSKVGAKNLANMKRMQMLETTQISIKVKLRRRTKGAVWEVVSQQDADETVTVLASHKQDGFNRKRLQKNLPPCVVEPDILTPPPHPNASCGCQPPSCDVNLNQKDGLGTTSCPQHQESDEQIEKLLEDIMMGLNILPNVEKDFKKPHDLQQGHVGVVTAGQVPVTQNIPEHGQVCPAVSLPGCTFCPDMGTRSCHSVSETAQKPPDSSLSVQLGSVAVLQQLQRTADGASCEGTSRFKIQECLHAESRTKSAMASTAFCAGQKQQHLPLQEAPGQDTEHILDHVATATDAETQSEYSVVLPWMNEMQIPPCLSPLGPCTSATKNQAIPYQGNHTDNLTHHIQPKASLHRRPWLTENPGCRRFPPGAITHMKNKTAEPCTMKHVEKTETISGYQQDGADPNSEPRKIMDSLKCKQAGTSGELVAAKRRKRKYTSHLQDTAPLLAYEDVCVGDGTKYVKMSSCSVSLSTNNILAKERERAISSLNITSRLKRKARPLSPTAESLKEKTKEPTRNTDRAQFRTRGFMKKEPPALVPVACRASPVNDSPLIKRKRGRPPKIKVVDLTPTNNNPALVHEKNNSGQSQDNPVFLSNVMQEMASQMGDEEQPLKNLDEGKSCDAAGSSATAPDLVDAGGLSRTTGSDKEEEEVEVDILLFSPHRTPPVTSLNMEIPPNEEEEEEMIEIDVTGDEAE